MYNYFFLNSVDWSSPKLHNMDIFSDGSSSSSSLPALQLKFVLSELHCEVTRNPIQGLVLVLSSFIGSWSSLQIVQGVWRGILKLSKDKKITWDHLSCLHIRLKKWRLLTWKTLRNKMNQLFPAACKDSVSQFNLNFTLYTKSPDITGSKQKQTNFILFRHFYFTWKELKCTRFRFNIAGGSKIICPEKLFL